MDKPPERSERRAVTVKFGRDRPPPIRGRVPCAPMPFGA